MTLWKITIRGRNKDGQYDFAIEVEATSADAARHIAEAALEPGERVIRTVRARNPHTNRFRKNPE